MASKLISLVVSILVTAAFWLANKAYVSVALTKWYYTSLAFTATYFVFAIVLEEVFSRPIKNEKAKFAFKKAFGVLFWAVFLLLFIRLWVVNPQALLVAYGLVAAGVAISLQDFFKNFVGGIIIFTRGIYSLGDRIEVNNEYGDVIDIGIMYTTLMEMREWVSGDQATGRICTVPNGYVLSHVVNNYTKDHAFIWDEISIPITYGSDWKRAARRIKAIVENETSEDTKKAEKDISKIKEKYFVSKRDVQPNIYITLTDNWINFSIRYVTDARQRRLVHNRLSQLILEEIQKSKDIKIASETLDIIGMPPVRMRRIKG